MYAFTVDVHAPIEQYDMVHAEVARRSAGAVPGLLVHFGRSTATGFQVLEIWETKEQCDRFSNEIVGPVIAEMAAGQPMATQDPVMTEFDPHGLMLAARANASA
ncbi:hypothetical protein [Modestobacter sp. NPDC049651]|uniref:hypothetical protein n=1 Tax=unclassified Modestobacter TaxID=2643866 RepID=UPI0034058D1F